MSPNSKNSSFKELPSSADHWLIRLESQEVKGPYSTEAISKMILEGIFSGQEDIAKFPEGDWKSLSKQPEFYESLLESLENPIERDEKKALKMEAETVIRKVPSDLFTKDIDLFDGDDGTEVSTHTQINEKKEKNNNEKLKKKNEEELRNKKLLDEERVFKEKQQQRFEIEKNKIAKIRQEKINKFKLPIFILIISTIGYFMYVALVETPVNNAWALITPQLNKAELSNEENKKLKIEAISLIKKGVIDDLIKVQNVLIKSVEGKSNDSESLGLLCMTYYQMWPYTRQLSTDLKAISAVYQQVKQVNPLSNYSDTCHAVYLIAKSQINDGRAVVEKALDNPDRNFILSPFLHLIKGEFYEDNSSLINAEAYYNEALKLFPLWTTAEWKVGRILYKQNKIDQSIQLLENILKRNQDYKPALYSLALAHLKNKNSSRAQELFEKAYSLNQLVPKTILVESLNEYAHMLIDQQKKKKALDVIRSALAVSPSHRALNDLFISLGGENLAIGEAQVSELIIEGDQFFRLNDFLAAQGRYRSAFDNDGKNTLLALKIAKSMRALNQFNDSIKWIDKALSIDSKYFSAYSLKAEFLMQRYNFVDAELSLNTALKIDPQNYEILKTMTKLQWKKNNLVQALNYGIKAYKKFDVDVELLTLLATINIELYFKPGVAQDAEKTTSDKIQYLETAQKYSARAIEIEPAWTESQITYAKFLFAKEGSLKSEKYYEELIKNFPYTIDYRLALAEFYESQEKTNSATEIYKLVAESEPKNAKAQLGLARCYKAKLDYGTSIKYYLVGSALDSSDAEPMFSVAQLQLEMALSESNASKADKLLSESYSRFELVKTSNPHFPKVYYFMAKNKLAQGQFEEARKYIDIEKSKNPLIADPYILSAEMSQKQNQFKDCAKEYMAVIKLRPVSDYYFKAAACHRLAGNIEIAEDLVNEGHALEKTNYIYFRELGYIQELRGEKNAAIQSFQDYLFLTANNSFDAKEIENKIKNLTQ